MTRRDFISLADHLRPLDLPEPALDAIVAFCKSQNPRFLEERWRGYLDGTCGPGGGSVKQP